MQWLMGRGMRPLYAQRLQTTLSLIVASISPRPTFSLFLAARPPSSAPSARARVTPSSSPSLAVEMLAMPSVLPVSRLNSFLSAAMRRSLNCVLNASTTCGQG